MGTPMDAAAHSNVRKFYAYRFVADFALWGGVWIKYLTVDRGLELRWILLMDMPFWLLIATLEVPFGTLGDRIGRKPVMALGTVAFAITLLGFSLTTNYWLLFADYVIWAVSMALSSGVDQALLYDTLKEAGEEAFSFLLYDFGYTLYNDTIAVTKDTLANDRELLVKWLRASRKGRDAHRRVLHD